MAEKDRTALYDTVDSLINTNGVNAVTGEIMNNMIKDLIDSNVNKTSDAAMIAGNIGTFEEFETYMETNISTINP